MSLLFTGMLIFIFSKQIVKPIDRLKNLSMDIAPELKTLIVLIMAYSQGVEDGLESTIIKQTDNMEKLVQKLLYWVKIEKIALNKSRFDLVELIKDILQGYDVILKEESISINVDLDASELYMMIRN